jgi:citryl-CoA lyase
MHFKTKISSHDGKEVSVRGEKLSSLVGEMSFTAAALFTLTGKKPSAAAVRLFDAMLVACIEHGVAAPSAFVPRVVASTGNTINAALATGVLAIGDHHGGAIEAAARYLHSSLTAADIVRVALAAHERLAGLGHKVYKDADPRAVQLFAIAEQHGFAGSYVKKMQAVAAELAQQSGKTLPINVDGALAALMLELGLAPEIGKAIFVLGRLPGMIAHVHEEATTEKPYRRLDDDEVEYDG